MIFQRNRDIGNIDFLKIGDFIAESLGFKRFSLRKLIYCTYIHYLVYLLKFFINFVNLLLFSFLNIALQKHLECTN